MNTPRKPEPSDARIAELARAHGIAAERIRIIDETAGGDTGGDLAERASTTSLLGEYERLTDVRLRSSTEAEWGLYIAESTKIIERALSAGHRPRSFLMTREWFSRLAPRLGEGGWDLGGSACTGCDILIGSETRVEDVTGYHLHRGALASMQRPEPVSVERTVAGARRVVIVEDVVDHTNLGAIFRSAAGLGVDAVLLSPRCADPLYRRAIRVSMGTVFQVPWARFGQWPDGLEALKDAGFTVAALALEDDSASLRDFARETVGPVALVVGTEGDGLRRSTIAAAERTVVIPMAHGVDSLNVAAATAVACYALQEDA